MVIIKLEAFDQYLMESFGMLFWSQIFSNCTQNKGKEKCVNVACVVKVSVWTLGVAVISLNLQGALILVYPKLKSE